MVDLEILKLYGISPEGLKKRFNKPRHEMSEKVQRLVERFRNRAQAGRDLNLETYQVFHAMDQSFDACFKQITPTLLASLTDKDATEEGIMDTLRQWGMDPKDVIVEVTDDKTPNKKINRINAPAFFRVMVPLVLAYIKIRWARLVNDRKMVPLFKYSPVISDAYSRLKCDALTQRVEQMSRTMGYFETMKQEILRVLLYGSCVKFVCEEWFTECSIVEKDSPFVGVEEVEIETEEKDESGQSVKVKAKKIIVKEGLRYHLPHPTRTYIDQAYFPSTLNTDTGVKYVGHWKVVRWAEIMANEAFYNKEIIGYDDFQKWFSNKRAHSYWKNVLSGCSIDFPNSTVTSTGGSLDTENHVANWYSKDMADKPIVITEHFEKLVPKDHDLGDYPEPVWFRFVLAADDTVIYAAPLPGAPATWTGYDYAEGRTHNASMALEILPFQDQFSNLLTQMLLTTRQNLANVTLMDQDVFDVTVIDKIKNWGEQWYRNVVNLVPVSFRKVAQKQNSDLRQSVISHKFPMGDTNQMVQSMNMILDVLERVLVMSSQEVGQAASHEQTREEVKHISQNTSTRVTFTATGIDTSRDAWKKQIYVYLMAYGQDEFWAQVPMEEPIDLDRLTQLGFTYSPETDYNPRTRKARVKVLNKTAIAYESFASDRDGQDRVDDVETATAMTAFLDKVIAHPDLYAALGVDQVIEILNQIARFAGFPRDFKLVNTGQTQAMRDEIMAALQELAGQLQQQMQAADEDIHGALQEITKKNVDQDNSLKNLMAKINKVLLQAGDIPDPELIESPQTVPASPMDMQQVLQIGGPMN